MFAVCDGFSQREVRWERAWTGGQRRRKRAELVCSAALWGLVETLGRQTEISAGTGEFFARVCALRKRASLLWVGLARLVDVGPPQNLQTSAPGQKLSTRDRAALNPCQARRARPSNNPAAVPKFRPPRREKSTSKSTPGKVSQPSDNNNRQGTSTIRKEHNKGRRNYRSSSLSSSSPAAGGMQPLTRRRWSPPRSTSLS